ncbi:HD domain-containing phosphohydrolase [Bacillus kexueae]|uniref:HD domain-containing phosphohydrolase n=1 Tax=Aeribacillus kexueae TaxID=2078952 RepID=UPI001FAFA1A9
MIPILKPYLQLADAVIVINHQKQIMALNEAFEHMTGYSWQDVSQKNLAWISLEADSNIFTEHSREQIFYIRKKNGELRKISITFTPIKGEGETFFIGICRDVHSVVTEGEIRKVKKDILKVLAISCEIRDPSIESHLMRVQSLTEELIHFHNERCQLNLDKEYMDNIIHSSILHDIGKANIPEGILYKPGALTKYERMIIETHPLSGVDMLNKISKEIDLDLFQKSFKVAHNVILHHHERWDGTGYPHQLKGHKIPFEARVVGIVDVFEALTSRRSYKEAWTTERALSLLNENRGKHFDPQLVDSFIQLKQTVHQSA